MKKQTSFPFLHFLPVTSLFILVILANSCSSHYLRKADKEYEHLYYARAIEDYGKALKKKEPGYAVVNLARAYYKVNDIKNAEHYYKKAVALPEASTDDYLNYAKILMQKEDYDVAKVWLNLVTERDKGNALAPMLLNSIRYRQELFRDTTLWAIRKVQISGFINTFSPSIFESGIVFAADKKVATDSKTSTWTGNSYLDLYYSEQEKSGRWTTPQPLPGDINGKFHEGSAVFTQDGRTAYFTRNNYEKKKLGKSELNHSNLKLYRAEKVADSWTNIRELPFNNDAYSVGHPALSPDETLLYFISDKPGGFGGTDIWVAKKVGENWESPVNLGQTINSPGNEMFPYMHSDGSLYFSSDAHTNLGGLDIFVAYPKGKDWTNPQNLGYPLNSPKDDFGFCLNDDHKTGYLSSNRSGSVDEIYTFKSHPPTFYVKGIVTNAETGEPIPGVSVEAVTRAGKFIEQVPTNSMGKFQLKLPVDQLFDLKAGKEGFFEVSDTLSTEGLQYSDIFFKDFALTAIVIDKPIVLENIYYDLDKWAIREDAKPSLNKLAKILEDNPGIVIELSSHTDSRASNDYNQVLSYKRATSAVEYIYSRGIRRGRITARGYGETRLVNRCSDNVNCSEEEHQQNRRTEFKVVRIEGLTQ